MKSTGEIGSIYSNAHVCSADKFLLLQYFVRNGIHDKHNKRAQSDLAQAEQVSGSSQ